MRRLGAHLSISAGLLGALKSTRSMGGNCLQIFSSSPRMWQAALPSEAEAEVFRQRAQQQDIEPIFIHAKYLINLGSNKKSLYQSSIKSLKHDLQVAAMINSPGVIVHLGSHQGRGFSSIQSQLVSAIKDILEASPASTQLIIENSAGLKGKICSQLSEISFLIKAVKSKRLTWCLDTCHAWAAGIFFGKGLENTLMQNDLVKQLVCLHVNDSKAEFNSGIDRHENLGQGKIGLKKLAMFVNHPLVKHLPLIIETPGFGDEGPDKKNLNILKSLVNE